MPKYRAKFTFEAIYVEVEAENVYKAEDIACERVYDYMHGDEPFLTEVVKLPEGEEK